MGRPKGNDLPSFSRPPVAKEVFTKEMKAKFDALPGSYRHFAREFIKTGNLELSAKLAGMAARGDELDEAKYVSAKDALDNYGMGIEEIMTNLRECLMAERTIRDKYGNLKTDIDNKLRLDTIKLILQIRGDLDNKKTPSVPSLPALPEASVDLFESTDVDAKE